MKLLQRLRAALVFPNAGAWRLTIGLLLLYGLIYLPIGFMSGFLKLVQPAWTVLSVAAGVFWMPGITEELVFRGLLIPHPNETLPSTERWFWICLSWTGFVLYHAANPFAPDFFRNPVFLLGAALIGTICTVAYLQSGSLWTAVLLHWLIVAVWLLCLGGLARFQ